MRDAVDKLLEQELANLSIAGGLAARFLPKETVTESFHVAVEPRELFQRTVQLLACMGDVKNKSEDSAADLVVSSIVGSGVLYLNSAHLAVKVEPSPGGGSQVTVLGAAKEGLIKQHTAQKAIARFKDALLREVQSS